MEEQRELLIETIENWMGEQEQLDDMLVMGFRF
jgi:serine phosphatase RsbU (regulator of sigma subunit)